MLASDLESAVLLSMWSNKVEDGYLREPMPGEIRSALLTRFAFLDDAFSQQVDAEPIASMLHFFPGNKPKPEAYLYVLRMEVPAPSWAVADACLRARRGELEEKRFAPIPSLLRSIAWGIARPFWIERKRIATVLAARDPRVPESQDHRKRVCERILRELRERMLKNPQGSHGVS